MDTTRRHFLTGLASVAIIPVFGPHTPLSERPRTFAGWRPDEYPNWRRDFPPDAICIDPWWAFDPEVRDLPPHKLDVAIEAGPDGWREAIVAKPDQVLRQEYEERRVTELRELGFTPQELEWMEERLAA